MAGNPDSVPRVLLQNLSCNQVLHERIVLLTVLIREIPWVPWSERIRVDDLGQGFYRLTVYFGFMDRPDVAQALRHSRSLGRALNPSETWFLLSRTTVIPTPGEGMALWRERLFAAMARNARTASEYFNIPSGQVIELGTKLEI
jgi:KUP system potassium uptake protein